MLMTVTVASQSLKAIATAAGGYLDDRLNVNDKMSFQIQNLDANTIYYDIGVAAAVASGGSIPQNQTVNFTARPEDVYLIGDGEATDVRVTAEPII